MDYVIIDKLADNATAETVAIYAKGNVLPNMQYSLMGTPCNNIIDGNLCCYPANIQQLFPEDTLLVDMQVESYAGIPLWDSAGKVIGLIAILDGKSIQDVELVESILKLVSMRVAAEMERDRSERELAESQQFLQEVIDTVADPIFVKDRQHRWLLLNQAMSRLMRQAPEALLGKTDYDFFPEKEARLFWEKNELVFTEGGENINEESFTDGAGAMHTIVTSKRCFTDMHGNSILVGSIKDVTSLKQTQRHLEETANHLRSVLQTTPDYLWLKDSEGAYLACNPAAERLFGMRETDLVGKTDYDFFDAELADGFRDKDKEAMKAGAIRINEEWITLAEDKCQVLLETRKVPVRDGEGKLIGVLSIGRDITDRRQNEAALKTSEERYRASSDLLQSVLESSPDVIVFALDRDYRYITFNIKHQETMRVIWGKDITLGLNILDIIGDHPDRKTAKQSFDHALAGESFVREEAFGEELLSRRFWQTFYSPIHADNGEITGLTCFVLDITERKATEKQLTLLNYSLDHVNDTVLLISEDASILYVNEEACHILGYPRDQLQGMRVADIDPDYQIAVWPDHWHDLKTHRTLNFESRHKTADGQIYPVNITANYVEFEGEGYNLAICRDITEHKRFETRLALQNHALNHVGEAVYLVDEDARILQVNKAAGSMLGYTQDELLAMRIYDIDPDFDPEKWRTHWDDLRARGTITLETSHRNKMGNLVPIEVNANFITRESRHYNFALVRDISERKQAQDAIQRSQSALEEAQRIAHIGSWEVDMVNDTLTWSNETFRIWEIDKTQFAATFAAFLETVHPEDREKVTHAYNQSVTDKSSYQVEHRLLFPDSRVKYIQELGEPYFDEDGRPVRFIGTALDITERKQMEAAVRQREQEFRVLVEYSPDPIFRYDKECRRTYANPAVERLTGKSAVSLQNKVPSDASVLSMREGEKLVQIIKQVLETGQTTESEVEFITPDGQTRYFHNRYAPEFNSHGEVAGVISIAHDITDRKLAENLLHQREREFRTLVENLPTYVVRLDHNLQHIYANPAYLKAANLPPTDILGSHVSAFWRAENVSIDAYIALLTSVLRSGIQEEFTLAWQDEAKRLFNHLVRVTPEFSASGEVVGLLVLGFDITEHSRQQALELERQRVFETIAQGGELNDILEQIARHVESAKSGQYCCILLTNEEGSRLVRVAAPSLPVQCWSNLDGIELREESGNCATAVLGSERITVENFGHTACQTFARDNGLAACWSEPIVESSGKVLGVVVIYREQDAEAESQDLALLRQASYLSSIAIERKRLESQMLHQASYDSLTDLPNRYMLGRRLNEEVAKAERARESLALFFIDLDRFKEVNDTLGHDVGDLLLINVAQRISACVRESDTVARFGGDEFVVILTQVEDISYLGRLAQKIINEMAHPFHLGEHTAYVSASIGIAGYPLDADSAESLLGHADQAMYTAKEQGRNNFSFFTSDMQQQVQARMLLANDLRDAVVNNQLQVWYQPIVDITTGVVVKAEALLRWKHPVRGMVPPDKFIPIAEENGLIHEIGDWVFRQAVQVVQRWNAGNHFQRQISVNLSPRQFLKGNINNVWLEHLEQLNFDPAQITIEITEGLLLNDRPEILQILSHFGSAGMQVALDDFGTGYSAMAYLKKFPIDYLKIDRSFVRDLETDPGDRAIAEAIIVMAHKLGIKVIAEGVETTGQRDLLAAVGCEYVQGYLYGKPMPEDEFMSFVAQAY